MFPRSREQQMIQEVMANNGCSVTFLQSVLDNPDILRCRLTYTETGRSTVVDLEYGQPFFDILGEALDGLRPRSPQPQASWGKNGPVPDRSANCRRKWKVGDAQPTTIKTDPYTVHYIFPPLWK